MNATLATTPAAGMGSRPATPNAQVRRILVTVDFTPASRRAAEYAVHLANDLRARVTLMHVREKPVPLSDGLANDGQEGAAPHAIQQLSFEASAMQRLYPGAVDIALRIGNDPCAEILRAVRELDADLLVIAAEGYHGYRPPQPQGASAANLICHARCPILVVH